MMSYGRLNILLDQPFHKMYFFNVNTYFESLWICTISLRLNGLPVSKVELDSTDTRLLKGSHMLWASR